MSRLRLLGPVALLAVLLMPTIGQAQPAPPLTSVRVYGVISTGTQVWDYPSPGAVATPSTAHSGPELMVAVLETGYSSSYRSAQFNGQTMKLTQSIPQVDSGNRVWGYIRVFYYKGSFTSGSFTYAADSLVFPYRRLSTRINIR